MEFSQTWWILFFHIWPKGVLSPLLRSRHNLYHTTGNKIHTLSNLTAAILPSKNNTQCTQTKCKNKNRTQRFCSVKLVQNLSRCCRRRLNFEVTLMNMSMTYLSYGLNWRHYYDEIILFFRSTWTILPLTEVQKPKRARLSFRERLLQNGNW